MTETMKYKAAAALMRSRGISGNEQYLPMVYVVGDHIYWFRNVARRAAYCEKKHIETMTIEAAWSIAQPEQPFDKRQVDKHFDQQGEAFGTFLFCDSKVLVNESDVLKYEQPLKQTAI